MTAFQTVVSEDSIEGKAFERFVMTKSTARANRLFRSRRAASLRRGLRKSRRVRLLVVIVGVQLDGGLGSGCVSVLRCGKAEEFLPVSCFLHSHLVTCSGAHMRPTELGEMTYNRGTIVARISSSSSISLSRGFLTLLSL